MSDTARYRIIEVTGSAFAYRSEHRNEEGTWVDIGPAVSETQAETAIEEHKRKVAARSRSEPTERVVRYVD